MNWDFLDLSQLSKENKIMLAGVIMTLIAAIVTGCFTLLAAIVQRPSSEKAPVPTAVVLVVTATQAPTSQASLQAATNTLEPAAAAPQETVVSAEATQNGPFSLPWSSWLISFVSRMPQNTWTFFFVFMGVVGLIGAIALFYGIQLHGYSWERETVRRGFAIGLLVLIVMYILLSRGWGNIWWGLLIAGGVGAAMCFRYAYGVLSGIAIGVILGVAGSLLYLAIPGPLDGEIITSGSVIGAALGALLGALLIRGSILESD